MSDFSELLHILKSAKRTRDRDPLADVRWTDGQTGWFKVQAPLAVWRGGNQLGKALQADEPVLMADGRWVPIRDVSVGDRVVAQDGTATTVTGVYPQGRVQLYRATFDDGASVECCGDHLWTVQTPSARFRKGRKGYGEWSVWRTADLIDKFGTEPRATRRWTIPVVDPVQHPHVDLPLHPYVVGVLLGDGGLSRPDAVSITSADAEVIERVGSLLPKQVQIVKGAGPYDYHISNPERLGRGNKGCNPVLNATRALGMQGKRSFEKSVPAMYLAASAEQRLELLRGLLDTDGTIGEMGNVSFSSVSRRLADDVAYLTRSLGGKAKMKTRPSVAVVDGERRPTGRTDHRVAVRLPGVDVFHLSRHRARRRDPANTRNRVVISIKPTRIDEAVCISVDHPSRTFVTRDLIVTHNSFGQGGDAAMFGRNVHPYDQTHTGPVKVAICSKSWKQMDPLIRKLWDALPKHEIDPHVRYVPGQGIKGYKEPILRLVDGPGAGSEYHFYTYDAGTQRLAGSTFHRAYLDEPPPESFWGEIVPRLNAYGGHLRVSFTPTPDAPPQLYLRAMVQKWEEAGRPALGCPGGVYEHHTPLTEEVCIPRGGLFELPFMSKGEIESFSAALLPHEREMRLNGAWEPVLKGRWLEYFDTEACVHGFSLARAHGPPPGSIIIVGVDHGAGPGKQAAALIAADVRNPMRPGVWVLATSVAKGYTTPEQDARAIFQHLLKPWGMEYGDVDYWVGDRSTNANSDGVAKGNAQLKQEIARLARIPVRKAKWIETPKKYRGSVVQGFRHMNAIMARRRADFPELSHFIVSPQCKDFVTAAQEWRGSKDDPRKDVLDAVRYAVEKMVRVGDVQHDLGAVIGLA